MKELDLGSVMGPPGETGAQGLPGKDGVSPTVSIESVTTGEPGSSASVTNSGDDKDVVLNFTIPKGDKGDKGDPGEKAKTSLTTNGILLSANWTGSEAPFLYTFTPEPKEYENCIVSLDYTGLSDDTAMLIMGYAIITKEKTGSTITLRAMGTLPTVDIPVLVRYYD